MGWIRTPKKTYSESRIRVQGQISNGTQIPIRNTETIIKIQKFMNSGTDYEFFR